MLEPWEVTACIVTRGDVDLQPILDTFPNYADVIIWGPERKELHVYGRYAAIAEASTPVVFTQDDDCIFRHHLDLLALYQPGKIVSTYGHGDTPDGYDDMCLVHGGAIMDQHLPDLAFNQYLKTFWVDEGFLREADMINGTLTPHVHIDLPFEIRMEIATRENRMANQPWQHDLKYQITERARFVRDRMWAVA